MRRREFLGAISSAAIVAPFAACAQQPGRIPRIGLLMPFFESDWEGQARSRAFREGLEQLGWRPGQNISLEYRWVGADSERIRSAAKELVELKPSAIFAVSALTAAPLKALTTTIPIVFINIGDPVGSGFVASLAHPGGNITGFSPAEYSMWGKSLEILKEIAPSVTRVAVIYNPEQSPQLGMLRAVEDAAAPKSIKITPIEARRPVEQAIPAFSQQGDGGGLLVFPNPVVDSKRGPIIDLAVRYKLPAIYSYRYFVADGGLVSYGIDTAEQSRQAASYVDRILRGASPAELPVQQPTKFELVINLKAAKAIGLDVPLFMQQRANEVIE